MEQSINPGWMFVPSLAEYCLENYKKDIQDILKLHYANLFSKVQTLIDDVLEIHSPEKSFCAPLEYVVSQRLPIEDSSLFLKQQTKYTGRTVTEFEEVLVGELIQDRPGYAQLHENNRLIFISGAGGQGKTTQLLNLALDWSSHRSSILSSYDLLFYVQLNSDMISLNVDSFEEIFCSTYGSLPYEYKNKLKCLLDAHKNGFGVLFLLDDFEGLCNTNTVICNIIEGKIFPNSTVIVSGRPFWMKDFKCSREPDVIVDIVGIKEGAVAALFRHLLHEDEQALWNLKENCKQYVFDKTLFRVPIFAKLCCNIFQCAYAFNFQDHHHRVQPATSTELFNRILKILLKRYAEKNGRIISAHFSRSPLIDTQNQIPEDIQRLLYQLAKMSFIGMKTQKYIFTNEDLKEFMISSKELCNLGMLTCTGKTQSAEHCIFSFRSKMFQEYMSGMYLSKETSIWRDIVHSFRAQEIDTSAQLDEITKVIPSSKPKRCHKRQFKSFLGHLKSRGTKNEDLPNYSQKSIQIKHCNTKDGKCKTRKVPVEHSCSEFKLDTELKLPHPRHKKHYRPTPVENSCSEFKTDTELKAPLQKDNSQHTCNPSISHQNEPNPFISATDQKQILTHRSLYFLLDPFQNTVLFACGMKPSLTKQVLSDSKRFASRKVCKWNNHKYDVGFESALYCEGQDKSLVNNFFDFFYSLKDKSPTVLQFPRPYDEVATVHLAQDLSVYQASDLLKKWYEVDLDQEYLQGANIIKSDTNFIEMNDPCLFETLLLHKFEHGEIYSIKATGNYFPGFYTISKSFPNLQELIFDGVNFPSVPNEKSATNRVPFLINLKKLHLFNAQASYPLCPELQELFQSCYLDTLCLKRVHCNPYELCYHISRMSNLDRLVLSQMNLCFESLVHGTETNYQKESQKVLTDALVKLTKLESLDISDNSVGIALPGIIHAIQTYKFMELVINKCRISSFTFANCAPMFQNFQHLGHLDIGSNSVHESLECVIYWLKSCPTLKVLGLRNCKLNSTHFTQAAKRFQYLNQVTQLDISDNSLGPAMEVFIKNLSTKMNKLFMQNCSIRFNDAVAGSGPLKRLTSLSMLDIQDNPLHAGIGPVIKALKKANSIEVLHIQKCNIRPKHFLWICPDLADFKYLKELGFGKNMCCDDTKDVRSEVVNYLCKCKNLEKLLCCAFYGKSFNQRHVDQLKKKIKEVVIFRIEH